VSAPLPLTQREQQPARQKNRRAELEKLPNSLPFLNRTPERRFPDEDAFRMQGSHLE